MISSYFNVIFLLFISASCWEWTFAQDSSCADKIPDCRIYGSKVCVNYVQWSNINCAATCSFCTGPTATKMCKDYVSNCGSYTSALCTEAKYRVWAEDHCALHCGFCVPPSSTTDAPVTTASTTSPTTVQTTSNPTTPKPTDPVTAPPNAPCEDNINFCLVYSKRACTDITWADSYCRKWCARC